MTKRLSVEIPFDGFYESAYSQEIDREEEQWCEWRATEDNGSDDDEARHPEALRLTAGELAEILFEATSYSRAYDAVAREYAAAFGSLIGGELGIDLAVEFEEMTSPREYNFQTDRIFVTMPAAALAAMFERSKAEDHATLANIIRERFTSYDGFSSHYRNDLDSWLEKPLEDWDHNELGTLLRAAVVLAGLAWEELRWSIFEGMVEGSDFYQAWENAVDWEKVDALRAEARADKLADLPPDEAAEVEATLIRCPRTLDLFNRP